MCKDIYFMALRRYLRTVIQDVILDLLEFLAILVLCLFDFWLVYYTVVWTGVIVLGTIASFRKAILYNCKSLPLLSSDVIFNIYTS